MTRRTGSARAATLAGCAVAFAAASGAAEAIGPALLLDPEPAWAPARLLLALAVAVGGAGAGAVAAGIVAVAGRHHVLASEPQPIDLSRGTVVATAALALVLGAAVRFAGLERLPFPLWLDEVLLVPDTLALHGGPSDFRDSVRTVRDDGGRPAGTVGVLYLEAFRAALRTFGTGVFGVRFLSAAGGVLSLATAMLLGRALLPRGGAMLAGLTLAGLRWSLILSRWGWNMILLAPLIDVATLAAIRSRRRGSIVAALAAGLLAGLATHVYLSAWIAAPALAGFLLWPGGSGARRLLRAGVFAGALAIAALPLWLMKEGRQTPYLVRASRHNVVVEMRHAKSVMPLLRAARKALLAPWLADPNPLNDLPGRARLPILPGLALSVSFAAAILRPRQDLHALMLTNAGAGFLASLAWGERLSPNGARFAYLTTLVSVAVASGLLRLIGSVPGRLRRAAALAAVGALLVSGAISAGDLQRWDRDRGMYVAIVGQHTSVAWASLRWEPYGEVRLEDSPLYAPPTIDVIRRFRIVPRREAERPPPAGRRERCFRIAPPGTRPRPAERVVERVRDAWGEDWAVVLGGRSGPGCPSGP